jgi:cysteine desulfurase family protein
VIYLDNAATSWPKPESVYRTMDRFMREDAGNPGRGGHSLALAAERAIEETRLLAARLINAAEPRQIVFTLNCTDAINLGLKGLLKPGDHVVTSRIGHNSLTRPLSKLERLGVRVTRLSPSSNDGFLSAGDIEEAMIPETRLVVVTHASNVTGVVQPVEEYGAVVGKHGRVLMVDAAQTAGAFPIDVQAANIDLLAFSGHKGLLGPTGTGVLYIGDRVNLDSLREGGTGSHSEQEEQPTGMPNRYESGTPNTVGIAGLGAGLKYVLERGVESIRLHERSLREQLSEGLAGIPGLNLYRPQATSEQAPIVSFNLDGWDPAEVAAVLDQAFDIKVRSGLHCAAAAHKTFGTYPLGTVRASPGCFNTAGEIESALEAIGKVANSSPTD